METIPEGSIPATAAYVSALINEPWARDGRHCGRLVAEVQRALFGREMSMPAIAPRNPRERARLFAEHPERANWSEVTVPVHGAVAILDRRGRIGQGDHAGVYLALEGGGVLHSDAPHGVVFDTLPELALRGWVPSWFVPRP